MTPLPLRYDQGERSVVDTITVLPLHGKHTSAAPGHPKLKGPEIAARRAGSLTIACECSMTLA